MTVLEVTLILVGVVFVIASFFVGEKLSKKDIDRIVSYSESELKVIAEKQLESAEKKIVGTIEGCIDDSIEVTKRAMERETNEKIMAVDEYSNTVLDSMNKTHNEILFLYSMLDDKHKELTELANQLGRFPEKMKQAQSEVLQNLEEAARSIEVKTCESEPSVESLSEPEEAAEEGSHKEMILERYREGMPAVEIAKELGLGSGEVRLVIGLYKEECGAV